MPKTVVQTNVLFIEPDRVLGRTFAAACARTGRRVAVAPSAQSAIEAADAVRPNLVILELQLPEHDGIEFLHEFRSYADWRDVPVIIHTFMPPDALRPLRDALARDFGIAAILYKPQTSLEMLLAAIGRALSEPLTTASGAVRS